MSFLMGPARLCSDADSNMVVWRAYTSISYNDGCFGRFPCCYCCLQTSHQRFMLTFPGETPPKKPMFHAFSLAQESEIFSSEIEASGYSNAQLKEFIEKIYSCLQKYGAGCALINSILIIPLIGVYIEQGWMKNAIHAVVNAENARLLESPASFRWIVHLVGNGIAPLQVQLNLTAKKGYGNMRDLEAEQAEVMEIYKELQQTLGYRHPNCSIGYAKTIQKQRKEGGEALSPLGAFNFLSGQTAPVATGASTDSIANEIKKLQNLKDQGALSDAEFTAAKAKLLGL